jgi:mannitol/fructose-specific phosphotransferase system IIA component (Ntr-type)
LSDKSNYNKLINAQTVEEVYVIFNEHKLGTQA